VTEVVYAAESEKELIPLTMERHYKPHGWLQFHMSDKLRLDFSDDDVFHDSMKRLLVTLRRIFTKNTGTCSSTHTTSTHCYYYNTPVQRPLCQESLGKPVPEKQSAPRCRHITTPTPHHSIFTGRTLFLTPNQQC